MTASTQRPTPETPVVRPGATTGTAAATGASPTTPTPSTTGATGSQTGPGTEHLAQRAREDAQAAGAHARKAGDEMAAGARQKMEELKHDAKGKLDDARRQAETAVGEQKNRAAERLTGFASALRHASSDLDEQGQEVVSGFVRQAADGLDSFSGAVQRNDVDDLIGTIEDFARRQPAVFIGGAVLVGFGIARFAKSSADRRRGRGMAQPQRGSFETGPSYGAAPGTTYEGGV